MPACMVGVNANLEIFAPLGLDDMFDRVVRPNPLWQGPPRDRYLEKAHRYMRDWPSVSYAGEVGTTPNGTLERARPVWT